MRAKLRQRKSGKPRSHRSITSDWTISRMRSPTNWIHRLRFRLGARKGKMTIEFANVEDLNRIIRVLDLISKVLSSYDSLEPFPA